MDYTVRVGNIVGGVLNEGVEDIIVGAGAGAGPHVTAKSSFDWTFRPTA